MINIDKLKQLRTIKELSQKQIAELIGITQVGYHRIETGKVNPHQVTIRSIERVLRLKKGDLNI